jgi:hypothetical protein
VSSTEGQPKVKRTCLRRILRRASDIAGKIDLICAEPTPAPRIRRTE